MMLYKNRVKSIGSMDWLAPKPILLLIVLMGVLMPATPFLRYEDAFSIVWPFSFYEKNQTALQAIFIYVGITVFFVIGYNVALTHSPPLSVSVISDNKFTKIAIAMATCGIFTFFVIVYLLGGIDKLLAGSSDRTRAFSGLQGLFLVLNVLISVSIVWFVRIVKKHRSFAEVSLFTLYLICSIILIALQGQKSTIFIVIAAMAIIYNCKVRRIRISMIAIGVSALFVILMAYHVYKQEYLLLGRVVSISGGSQFWDSTYDFLNQQLYGNFMQLQTMSVLIEGMPIPLEYQYGYTYVAGLLLLIPRQIFPDKPLPSTGIFTEAFWPAAWNELGTTLPPGLFGEAYMNFGIAGAIAGGLLFGYVLGRVHNRYLQNPDSDMALIYYSVLVASILHFFRGELASVSYLILSIVLPCRLFMTKLDAPKRR